MRRPLVGHEHVGDIVHERRHDDGVNRLQIDLDRGLHLLQHGFLPHGLMQHGRMQHAGPLAARAVVGTQFHRMNTATPAHSPLRQVPRGCRQVRLYGYES